MKRIKTMRDQDWIIVTNLSAAFNREAAEVKAVLAKYNAGLGKTGIGHGQTIDIATGVHAKDQDAFIKEFKALPGVKDVSVLLQPCFPF
jgi:hypothetical protein